MSSKIKILWYFIRLIIDRRNLILEMVRREISVQYVGSWLGFVWTFINPAVMILIFWFVFGFGLKTQPMNDVPFVVWLTAGMAIWFCFSEIWSGSTLMVTNNAHLIKKVVFPSSIFPVVKILSSLVSHAVFLVLLILLIVLHDMPVTVYFFQAVYYFFAMSVLVLGLGWLTSALNVFLRDTGQVVQLLLQIGFWSTPIFWDIQIMPENVQRILKLNPVFYIVQGYRDSFIYSVPFWQDWQWALYYWLAAAGIFIVGALVFRRLKPHFADVI
ncbi:MAG TPA: ABC transporter permease [Thermodesulfobacteriaceae bacterium]|nr:ABC transporter permease [Thermodesulfobacteriaceae bacterium]